jgi:hypothetical protein
MTIGAADNYTRRLVEFSRHVREAARDRDSLAFHFPCSVLLRRVPTRLVPGSIQLGA